MNELLIFVPTWINLKIIMLIRKKQTKIIYVLYDSIYVKF